MPEAREIKVHGREQPVLPKEAEFNFGIDDVSAQFDFPQKLGLAVETGSSAIPAEPRRYLMSATRSLT